MGKKHCDLFKKKKIKALLACGVCPHGETGLCDVFCVLWCFPGWGSLCPCCSWWSWISPLWRAGESPVVGVGESMGSACLWAVLLALKVLDMSISTPTSKWPSAYFHCHQPKTCPWNLSWCFWSPAPPFTAGQTLLGKGLCGSFLDPLTVAPLTGSFLSAPRACPLCCKACVHLSQLTRPSASNVSFYFRIQLMKWKSPLTETILEYEHTRLK